MKIVEFLVFYDPMAAQVYSLSNRPPAIRAWDTLCVQIVDQVYDLVTKCGDVSRPYVFTVRVENRVWPRQPQLRVRML